MHQFCTTQDIGDIMGQSRQEERQVMARQLQGNKNSQNQKLFSNANEIFKKNLSQRTMDKNSQNYFCIELCSTEALEGLDKNRNEVPKIDI